MKLIMSQANCNRIWNRIQTLRASLAHDSRPAQVADYRIELRMKARQLGRLYEAGFRPTTG